MAGKILKRRMNELIFQMFKKPVHLAPKHVSYIISYLRRLLCKNQTKWEVKIFDPNVPTSLLSW